MANTSYTLGTPQAPPSPSPIRPISSGPCPDLDDLGLGAYPVGRTEDLQRLFAGMVTTEPMWRRSAGCC